MKELKDMLMETSMVNEAGMKTDPPIKKYDLTEEEDRQKYISELLKTKAQEIKLIRDFDKKCSSVPRSKNFDMVGNKLSAGDLVITRTCSLGLVCLVLIDEGECKVFYNPMDESYRPTEVELEDTIKRPYACSCREVLKIDIKDAKKIFGL